ncbi:MAG TPA: methylenetetrahydrofolate reductase [Thermodesulfobacteriota bacterium]|nr:methylenetetrahydrofolate reductase [Thermodesulfobacteriota bacterium]
MKSGSRLEKILTGGHFAVTGECGPPRGAAADEVRKKAAHLKGVVDSVNVTDNQTAVVRMSSMAGCLILLQEGLEPNLQMVVRDRNRIALQSDILGAYALGIRNMLCLSGDHQKFGDHPAAKNVFDLDSMQLIQTVRKMRDEGKFINDQDIHEAPKMFIGAAVNPFADPADFRAVRMGKKIAAGVDFVQTQCIYNMDRFEKFMQQARDLGLTEKVYILGGVTPMKSVGMANYMKNLVPGMDVPTELIDRMKGVPKKDQTKEGIKIAIETIQRLKEMKGIAGVHVMAIEWEERVPELVEMAGLLPRPQVD